MDPLIITNAKSTLQVTPKTDTVEICIGDNEDGTAQRFQVTAKEAFQLHSYFLKAAVKVQSHEPSPLAGK